MNKKSLQQKNKNIVVCNYCLGIIPKKHKKICADCGKIFCKLCLTEVGKDFLCNECLVYFMKHKVRVVITK